jgi:hypothetical protein
MHGESVGQCDWTGIMFKLPGVTLRVGKKRGHYCNWESAIAHARSVNTHDEFKSTCVYVTQKVGAMPYQALHYKSMHWFGGVYNEPLYLMECEAETGELDAISSSMPFISDEEQSVTIDSCADGFLRGWRV